MPHRIIFMGTPDFAVPTLQKLCESSLANNWQVVGVFTQPDRPAGRGNKLTPGPVKAYALAHHLPVWQPESFRKEPLVIEQLAAAAPTVIVVAAYGLLLPTSVLQIPTFGCINVHASLLPAYRGASPITASILAGRAETGISIMLMDEGLDTGPVIRQTTQAIQSHDTTATLSTRLAEQGADLLVETLPRWLAGELPPVPQNELPGELSHCGRLEKEAGRIDWQQPAVQIERMTRAYNPWPSAYTLWRGEIFKIWEATVLAGQAAPGVVVNTAQGVAVGSGAGLLRLHTVQPAGKRAMPIQSFLNGTPDFVGSYF